MESLLCDPSVLKPNPFNSNRVSPENMRKLKTSIEDLGFVTAVVCREMPDGSLQILGGQHRVEVACELGLPEIPVLNLGVVSEAKARKIGLIDNARYGVDDTISLAKVYDEIGLSPEDLAAFLPFTEHDFEIISSSVDIDLDALDMMTGDEPEGPTPDEIKAPKPQKTHEVMRFRLPIADAEKVRILIERTMKDEGLDDDDELTAAGSALAFLLLNGSAN